MKKKLMTLALAVGFSLVVLTGCSKKPTVESLVDGMFDSEIESQRAEIETDIELSLAARGVSFDITAGGDFEMQVSGMNGKDDLTTYIDGKVNVKVPAGSVDEKLGFETYSVVDDETLTYYACADDDVWYMVELDDVWDQDAVDKMFEEMKDVLKENGELAEDTEKVEGEECYVITAAIKGRDCAAIFKPMRGMIDDAVDEVIDNAMEAAMKEAGMNFGIDIDIDIDMISWSEYWAADITCYISKDTGYLVKAEIDMSDTDLYGMAEQMLKDFGGAAEQMLKDFGQEDGSDFIQDSIDNLVNLIEEISVSEFNISVVYSDINDTEVEVPDDVVDDAVEIFGAGTFGDLMGAIDDDVTEEPPEPSVDMGNSSNGSDEWYHGDSFTLHKNYESDEFLCEVKIPDGWIYDDLYSDPEEGLVSLETGGNVYNGYIWVQNSLEYPLYNALINDGELPADMAGYYANYNMDITVIGTAFGGNDVMLVEQSYDSTDGTLTFEETFICIEYNDGGYKEYLSVDCGTLWDLEDWTEDDFLDLAVSLFGR